MVNVGSVAAPASNENAPGVAEVADVWQQALAVGGTPNPPTVC